MIDLVTLSLMLTAYFVGTFVYFQWGSLLYSVLSFLVIQLSYIYFMFYV